uniref:NADH:ubiquinone oxidoreductase subunit V3 n=1 Tax=Rousettus aegyptiacus TaxID=9407 RepID=A0A7J8HUH4_ROUAE|nr:NADH:ubiquinone oxidoreductase subunit V3 [Rousettus aegyptiacus]
MAALLLRQGRARALKTMLLEGPMFQGLAPAVSLSAKSGKSDQGLPPKPKKQSPPKDVVGPKERGRPLSSPAAARLPRHAASCGPPSPVPSRGGTVAIPGPDDSSLAADEGVPKAPPKPPCPPSRSTTPPTRTCSITTTTRTPS